MIKLVDVKRYYKNLPHQQEAVRYLGGLLLKTPAADSLDLNDEDDLLTLEDEDLVWLQKQISHATLAKFAEIWRNEIPSLEPIYFSQRDNSIKPYVTCNSSSHAMLTDYYLRASGRKGLSNDETYLRRVFGGKYGRYGSNPSVSWDIQERVAKSFGIGVKYHWDSNEKALREELENGVSCVNIYHKGNNSRNRGGGHVILAVDYSPEKGYFVFDPFGYRCGHYTKSNVGKYWIPQSEWDWRWQGCRTKFIGLTK